MARPRRPVDCCAPAPLPRGRRPRALSGLARALGALAEPTRLLILERLAGAHDPVCVCDFVSGFGLKQPTVSHHLAVLRQAGLVSSTRRGRWAYYRLEAQALGQVLSGLAALLPPAPGPAAGAASPGGAP